MRAFSPSLREAPELKSNLPDPQLAFGFDGRAPSGLASAPAAAVGGVETDPARLEVALRLLVGSPVRLVVHGNRSTLVSFRKHEGHVAVRVHRMFLAAGPGVVRALGEFVRTRSRRAGEELDAFIKAHRTAHPPPPEPVRERPLETQGRTYDLAEIYRTLNANHFGGGIDARIGWGRGAGGARRRRSIRMGAYLAETRTIVIHPALDQPEVPRFFVELVVFHEMLHQAVPALEGADGRRCVHTAEFKARERQFPEYLRARAWERRHLAVLLRPAKAAATP